MPKKKEKKLRKNACLQKFILKQNNQKEALEKMDFGMKNADKQKKKSQQDKCQNGTECLMSTHKD